jgi:hypothetical protein
MALVALCVPHAGSVRPNHTRAIEEMQNATPQHRFYHAEIDLMIVGKARNMCIEAALPSKPDVIWFIDDDVIIPPNAGVLVDQALSLGIVSGVYYSRRLPYTPQIYNIAPEPQYEGTGLYWPYMGAVPPEMFEADAVGAGCLAINTQILLQMQDHAKPQQEAIASTIDDPWFKRIVTNLSPWFEFLDRKGEDMYFCERAKAQGFKIWVNPQIQCLHMGEIPVGAAHHQYLIDNGLIHKEELLK